MLDSVLYQTYPNWELCLANGSTDTEIEQVITQYQSRDSRIHAINMVNKGISGNSNAALELASGTYLVLLDHDDRIAPDLLFQAAAKLNRKRNADIIYYDKDKIELDGSRVDPYIKPRRFRYKQFLYNNFLNHSIFKKDLIDRVGMFLDPEMDGAQDWDFFYKCIEITNRIVHIPRVLYSWRKIEGSAALDTKQKPYALEKQNAAREAHLKRIAKNK
jgi:glycosyltransferase involved in cell wall biosynthesis